MTNRRGTPRSRRPSLRSTGLTAAGALGVLCLLVAAVCVALGLRPLVVTSGSMSPTTPAGSLAFAETSDARTAEVGDVVVVATGDGYRVMHRVVETAVTGERAVLTLKGDANATPDADPYVVESVGRVRFDVPWLGYPISWLATPWGLFLLATAALGLLLFAFRRGGPQQRAPQDPPAGGRRRAVATLAAPVALAAIVAGTGTTGAWFTDTGTITTGAAATHVIVRQAQPVCTNVDGLLGLGNVARLTWTHVDTRYEYVWELRNASTGALVTSGTAGAGQAQGSTVTLDLSTGLTGVNTDYNVVVRAGLRSAPTWVAATTTTTPVRRTSVLILGAAMRCGHG